MDQPTACALCGLPVRERLPLNPRQTDLQFCCNGCKMVYNMLMESDDYKDVADFTQTALYRKCVDAGIIPDPTDGGYRLPANDDIGDKDGQAAAKESPAETGEYLTWHFTVTDMWCPACAWIVEDALSKTKGALKASCNFSSDRGKVLYDPVKTSPDAIRKVIENLGYGAAPIDKSNKRSTREFVRFAVSLIMTMNVMMLSWAVYSGFFIELSRNAVQLLSWPIFVMATIVLAYGGYPIHMRAIAGIRAGLPGMETLITVGSVSAYIYSVFNFFEGGIHLYFDAASMLILLVLIGKMLERSAKNRINEGLADFFSLAPEKVRICTGRFPRGRYVSVKQLSAGDIFQAEPGEILAADGTVVEGEAVIDESSITGEPKPYYASLSDKVRSGTRIISGLIRAEAQQVGEDSVLGRMTAIMENNLSGKTRRSARFEGMLRFFVPTVIGLAALVFMIGKISGLSAYDALNRGLSVMVISCPCALGIAIPLALAAGVTIAGKSGILVRDFEAFEKSEGLDAVVFDKTGTLTYGSMVLLGVDAVGDFSSERALRLACSLEADSAHFIAEAVKNCCMEKELQPLPVMDIQEYPNGLRGVFEGKELLLGGHEFVGAESDYALIDFNGSSSDERILTEIFLSVDGTVVASLKFGDVIRNGVQQLIAELKKRRISLHLVSGDAKEAALKAALSSGIEPELSAGGLLPHNKAEYIRRLKKKHKKVAMVGDGVNDAPAMAEADLAAAVRSGLNPGEGAAAITLMREDPAQLLDYLLLAKKVNRKVKQNLVFALIYNLIGIPIAAAGLLNPIIAVTAMLCSSMSVTLNTLLLVRKEISANKSSLTE